MDLPRNRFKAALAEGRPQIGLWVSLIDGFAAEAVAGAGFDWLLLDTEHSPGHELERPRPAPGARALSADPDRPPDDQRHRADQALPRHRRADPAHPLRPVRRRGRGRRRRHALPAARRARHLDADPRHRLRPHPRLPRPRRGGALPARPDRDPRRPRRPRGDRRRRRRATASSSAPPTSRRASATSATPATPRSSPRSRTPSPASAPPASPPASSASTRRRPAAAIALGTTFTAVGTDLSLLARGADALCAEYRS